MIVVLYKDGKAAGFIDNVTSIDGDTIVADGGGAKGVQHDIIVLDQASIRYDRIESGRVAYTDWVPDDQGIPQPEEKVNIYYTDIPVLVTDQGEYKPGDAFDPSLFTDQRTKLGKTEKQRIQQQFDDMTLVLADILAGGV